MIVVDCSYYLRCSMYSISQVKTDILKLGFVTHSKGLVILVWFWEEINRLFFQNERFIFFTNVTTDLLGISIKTRKVYLHVANCWKDALTYNSLFLYKFWTSKVWPQKWRLKE